MSRLTAKIMRFLELSEIFPEPGTVLVACSGGPDSVALAQALFELGLLGGLAHINYQLREEAGEEAVLVEDLAKQWGVSAAVHVVEKGHFEQKGLNLQSEARQIRYAWFEALLAQGDCMYCATGHQEDDQVETLLFSLLRVVDGPPKGIPAVRGHYIRPLLSCSRTEILDFLRKRELAFATDLSNLKPVYDRNFIRHELLPRLQEAFPGFRERLLLLERQQVELLKVLAPRFSQIESHCIRGQSGDWKVDLELMAKHWPETMQTLFLENWLASLGWKRREVREGLNLRQAQPGKMVLTEKMKIFRSPKGFHIRSLEMERSLTKASIFKIPRAEIPFAESMLPFQITAELLPLPKVLAFPAPDGVHWLDASRLHWPLTIRRWEAGDRVTLLGMAGSQKLSDLFVNAGWDRFQKEEAVVVEDQTGIVLVGGFRIADRVKIEPETNEILHFRIERI